MKLFTKLTLLWLTLLIGSKTYSQQKCETCTNYTFIENKGQWEEQVLYKADVRSGAVFFEKQAITFNLFNPEDIIRIKGDHHKLEDYRPQIDYTIHYHAFKILFEGAQSEAFTKGGEKVPEYFNYFIGNNPAKWASRAAGYTDVNYNRLYKGISLNVTSQHGSLKYTYTVSPGADAAVIKQQIVGVDALKIDEEGNLVLITSLGNFSDSRPVAYQVINGKRREVACNFSVEGNRVSYHFPQGYDRSQELIIDPTLVFSTYSGSFSDNFGYTATYDNLGNGFAAGSVFGTGYPVTTGAYQVNYVGGLAVGGIPGDDIGITKYNTTGTARMYATYLGGFGQDLPHSLVVNSNDELYILGTTDASNYPVTTGAYDISFNGGTDPNPFIGIAAHYRNGSDIVISKLSADGSQLLASTFVGGSENDGLNYRAGVPYNTQGYLRHNYADEVRGEIDIDANNNVYVASCTRSANFPRVGNSFQTVFGGELDACVFKMDANLTTMIWSTTFGGTDNDAAYSVAIDKQENIYVAGGTRSGNFPATNTTLQNTFAGGEADGFVIHISKDGQQNMGCTYYGYDDYDQIYFVELDKSNNVYVFGQADNADTLYIKNAIYGRPNGGQFISKLTSGLDSVIWSTCFGRGLGRSDISPTAFLVDVCNSIYACGWGSQSVNSNINGSGGTLGLDVTPGAYRSTTDGQDFYLMVLRDDASALTYATFMGGNVSAEHVDGGTSRFNKSGVVYQSVCAGCGSNSDFPISPGAYSPTNNSSNCNNAIFKFDLELPLCLANFSSPNGCLNQAVPFTNSSSTIQSPTYQWYFGDGATSTQVNPTHLYTQPGVYNVTLVVNDPGSCNLTDTLVRSILVLGSQLNDTLPTFSVCNAGSIQIGLPPTNDTSVTYHWSPSATLSSSTVSNPFAFPTQTTQYALVVSNGVCRDTLYQTVQISSDSFNLSTTQINCPGDTIVLSLSNFTGNNITSYSWAPANVIIAGQGTANPLAVPTTDVTFVVTIQTAGNCVYTDSIRYQYPDSFFVVNAGFISPTAGCVPDTLQFINTTTGSGAISYQWYFGDGSTTTLTNPTHVYTQSGFPEVMLVATDNNACNKRDTARAKLVILSDTVFALPPVRICDGDTTLIGVTGADSSLSYLWQPGTSLSATNVPNPQAFPTDTTTYLLLVSNARCADSVYQRVDVFKDSIYTDDELLVCPSSPVQLSVSNAGRSDSMAYSWQPTAYIVSGANTDTPLVSITAPTTFSVTGVNEYGCVYTDTVRLSIYPSVVQVQATATPDTIDFLGSSQLLADTQNAVWLQWREDSTLSAFDIVNPVASPLETRTYLVQARDTFGCYKTDTVTVYVRRTPCQESNIYIPNAFSPNADGKNDVLYVRGNNITKLYFAVYDRWGQRVFESRDITVGWDGNFKGKKIDPAVFGYYVEGECPGGEKFFKKGNVTLLR